VNHPEQGPCAFSAETPDEGDAWFGDDVWEALVALRAAYERGLDLLSGREQAQLRFVRWLVETGRLDP
jgi:hypothetical protein